jgi:hypothetical protein
MMLERAEALSQTSSGEAVMTRPSFRAKCWEYRQRCCRGPATEFFDAATSDLIRRAAAPFIEDFDPSLTANGTDDSGGTPGDGPSDAVVRRYGRVSRRLRAAQGRLYSVLAAYHGLLANRHEMCSLGRLVVIMPLTDAGERLLAGRARRLGEHDEAGQPAERLLAEWQMQVQKPDDLRRRLFSASRTQAAELLHRAHEAYAGAGEDEPAGPTRWAL